VAALVCSPSTHALNSQVTIYGWSISLSEFRVVGKGTLELPGMGLLHRQWRPTSLSNQLNIWMSLGRFAISSVYHMVR
jgi:hypothetical protein